MNSNDFTPVLFISVGATGALLAQHEAAIAALESIPPVSMMVV